MNERKPSKEGYALIDFGEGRKLERFGDVVIDRPALGARCDKSIPDVWESAELIYEGSRLNSREGGWKGNCTLAEGLGDNSRHWDLHVRGLQLRIIPQRTGQVGVFPEHWNRWDWYADGLASIAGREPPTVLHLFAYSGATTLWMARQGAKVTHVDAMKQAVAWARLNAELSGLSEKPIRWIVEDARKYVTRELKRGVRYDLIVLDPPSYGHGRSGEAWEIHRDLVPLMRDCWQLLRQVEDPSDPREGGSLGVVLSCHSRNVSAKELRMELEGIAGEKIATEVSSSCLTDQSGRSLAFGDELRFYRA